MHVAYSMEDVEGVESGGEDAYSRWEGGVERRVEWTKGWVG